MKRIAPVVAAALGASLALAAGSAAAQTKTLRFVAHADVKIVDPTFTTAYISRNFGYMVYDTLFAQDATGVPKPQMVDKYTSSKDGKEWRFTLRPGIKFSDGKPVTALPSWNFKPGRNVNDHCLPSFEVVYLSTICGFGVPFASCANSVS
jgi:peptide/nickel transport system substrate-binding protein